MKAATLLFFLISAMMLPAEARGLATNVVSNSNCRAAMPMLNTNLPTGVISKATNIKHALVVSDSGTFIAYIYVQENFQSLLQDGYINARPVPEGPRERLFSAVGLARDGSRSRGEIYVIAPSVIVKIIAAGFLLDSCY